ncbi:Protein NRT1/ PTR FAMILY 4.7 [Morella rubra]|uniref:Protein NRT1/ PTR FAMILY 4.7 n=1 Tax=Morella rubra TaxID=262757 RepID=A0A6A1VWU5_9ROSI|nr:Protein NRT1/ PTR FAMILY 4.7 [Morella rubra]
MDEARQLHVWEGYVDWRNRPALRGRHGGCLLLSLSWSRHQSYGILRREQIYRRTYVNKLAALRFTIWMSQWSFACKGHPAGHYGKDDGKCPNHVQDEVRDIKRCPEHSHVNDRPTIAQIAPTNRLQEIFSPSIWKT